MMMARYWFIIGTRIYEKNVQFTPVVVNNGASVTTLVNLANGYGRKYTRRTCESFVGVITVIDDEREAYVMLAED